ncbi:TPA: aspartate/glutamate racemase family protein [Candidatus Woesearchaeota archaeon]|nr:aspartate/glutamate racemase family protein [Candidatus Woesearchaeota archaeon]HIJ03022.1 aspartate/glutamate racemase family protein [Candidatus Woesearchaeota archaeon]
MVFGGTGRIGVLGGIGPEATGLYYNKLIRQLQRSGMISSNRDFPHILINSIPAPELIHETILPEELEHYRAGLLELDKLGVEFIVMVCNTIHLYYDYLQSAISTPILDLRKELLFDLHLRNIKSTTVIGTPSTIKEGLYDFPGIRNLHPTTKEMQSLSRAIFLFNKGIEKTQQRAAVRAICEKYLGRGADTIILGCTEFAAMLEDDHFSKISTIDVLVDATIRRSYRRVGGI